MRQITFFLLTVILFAGFTNINAQNNEKILKLKINKDVNGEVMMVDTTIYLNENQDVQEVLDGLGLEDNFNKNEDIDIDFDFDLGNANVQKFIFKGDGSEMPHLFHNDDENRAFLGVFLGQEKEAEIKNGIETITSKIFIEEVMEGGAAKEANLQAGDEILAIDNNDISDIDGLTDYLSSKEPGDEIAMLINRDGEEMTVNVNLKAKKDTPYGNPQIFMFDDEDFSWMGKKGDCHFNWKDSGCCDWDKKSCCDSSKKPANKVLLGVYPKNISGDLKEELNLNSRLGVYVDEVIEESAAAAAGLEEGDIITQINGTDVNNKKGLIDILAQFEPDERITVNYIRDGKSKKTKATLLARSNDESRNFWITDMEKEDERMVEKKGLINQSPLQLSEISFFPNPNEGIFTLNFSSRSEAAITVQIVDLAGHSIYVEEISPFSGSYSNKINIAENEKGVYLLQIIQDGKAMTKKLVIE